MLEHFYFVQAKESSVSDSIGHLECLLWSKWWLDSKTSIEELSYQSSIYELLARKTCPHGSRTTNSWIRTCRVTRPKAQFDHEFVDSKEIK